MSRRKLQNINPDYVSKYVHEWGEKHKITMKALGSMLGHSSCYIQQSCRDGKMPEKELSLLCDITGMDKDKALCLDEVEKEQKSDDRMDVLIEKMEQIVTFLESIETNIKEIKTWQLTKI